MHSLTYLITSASGRSLREQQFETMKAADAQVLDAAKGIANRGQSYGSSQYRS